MSTMQAGARRGGGRARLFYFAGGLAALGVATPAFGQEQTPQQPQPQQASSQAQVYEPGYFARFAPKTAMDMVANIPGFEITSSSNERGFGQARQNVLINGRRVSGKSNDAATALGRITAESVLRIEIVDGATLNIPGLSGQVANVIAKVDALSGNWSQVTELREDLKPSFGRASVSANGKTDGGWSWSAALNTFEFHNGNAGLGWITNGSGQLIDERRENFRGNGQEPSLDATVTYEAVDGAVANMNLSLRSFNFVGRETSHRNPVNSVPEDRYSFIGEDELGGEIGGDYEFDLGPGRLKLIALERYEDGDDLVTVESYNSAGAANGGARVIEHSEQGETIGRAEYGFRGFDGDIQIAAEGAFNFLDVVTEYADRKPDGSYPLVSLPEGTARVEERRAETNISYSRKLDDAWSMQSSLGVEYSELAQEGAGGLTREFVRPKGFVSLAWKPDSNFDVSVKAERKVGQLRFGDFLSSVDLQNNASSGGNVDLVPQQSWILSSEINQKLGEWGAVKLQADYRLIEDVVDQKLIIRPTPLPPLSGVGNIGEATAWSVTGSGTVNFDPIGAKGLQFNFNWRYNDSEVDDPLTGIPREISYDAKLNGNMSLRWDIPDTKWTIVGGIEENQQYPGYRLDQVSRNWTAPSINFFHIENKDVFGMKVRLQVVNVNDTSENSKREVFLPAALNDPNSPRLRTNPLDFTEERHRTFGPIVRLFLSGTF
ncbi:MAG: TonB-dependent receptor plug domain-containing protein [Hyphomonadaceae bacterium]